MDSTPVLVRARILPLYPILLFALSACGLSTRAAEITDIRWGRHEGFSRCVLEFNGDPPRVTLQDYTASQRILYCDFSGTSRASIPASGSVAEDSRILGYTSRYLEAERRLRLSVRVDRAASPRTITLSDPGRVVIDLYWDGNPPDTQTPAYASAAARTETKQASQTSGFASWASPWRYFTGSSGNAAKSSSSSSSSSASSAAQTQADPPAASAASSNSAAPSNYASTSSSSSPRSPLPFRPVIIIDPGHGGWHKGAIGKVDGHAVMEKDVAMKIAVKLKNYLQKSGEFDVRMTRTSDDYVGLVDRVVFAEEKKGDLFVSIHCNATDNGKRASEARGLELWFWNKSGSSNAAAKHLEQLENDESGGVNLSNTTARTRRLLSTLMADRLEEQALLSGKVADRLAKPFLRQYYFKQHYRGIHSARFKVLENYMMPSVLVEVGFLSHPQEARLLASDKFQDGVARCLADGIREAVELINAASAPANQVSENN